jgi:chlorophyllide a oxygenase
MSEAALAAEIADLQAQLADAESAVASSESALAGTVAEVAALGAAVGLAPAAPVAQPPSSPSPRPSRARAGLAASLALAPGLREFWYPAAFSADVKAGRSTGSGGGSAVELFGEWWELSRSADGKLACTAAPSSSASSSTSQPPTLPIAEADGLVWVWPGAGPPPPNTPLPTFAAPPRGYRVHAELVLDVPVDSGLLLENLLDLAHAPFTHTGTFAKGWPVPDAVRFHASAAAAALAGAWDPYPIDMAYAPPAGVVSTIGLAQPGKVAAGATAEGCARHLHQLHVVLPAGDGRSRLLYRMALDFWGWAAHVPGVAAFWRHIAGKVLGEDLVLVAGQQDRLARGGDVWGAPVPYDKLAVRCRRWRNAAGAGDEGAAAQARGGGAPAVMRAGELLFGEEEEDSEEEEGAACS